jgi:hypothetical protein
VNCRHPWRKFISSGKDLVFGDQKRDCRQLAASFFTALIITTTALNFTFAAVSILFMLLLMRGDVLILSPGDITRRRQVRGIPGSH